MANTPVSRLRCIGLIIICLLVTVWLEHHYTTFRYHQATSRHQHLLSVIPSRSDVSGNNYFTKDDANNLDVNTDNSWLHAFPNFSHQDISRQHAPGINTPLLSDMSQDDTHSADFSFRDRYFLWERFNPPRLGPDTAHAGNGYFIYKCDSAREGTNSCGGWADRLKGALVSYVIANLTGRVFKAELASGCDMTDKFLPNIIDWTWTSHHLTDSADTAYVRHFNQRRFKGRMRRTNFTQEFPHAKYIYYLSNLDNLSRLKQSPIYAHQLSWMRDLSAADVYAAIYKRLFKLGPSLQERLKAVVPDSKHLTGVQRRLICVHVRMGKNPTMDDSETRNSEDNLPKIWDFLSRKLEHDDDKVFVMSDSQDVVNSALSQSFSSRLVTVQGDIVHIDHVESGCPGLERLLLEHHLLMTCDILVKGHSGLSDIAGFIRGSDQGLFCLRKDGTIDPCRREDSFKYGSTFI